MTSLQIPTARVFLPLLKPARYKAIHGGRGGGKSHFFAGLGVEESYCDHVRLVCIREVQKDLKESVMQLILDKIEAHGLMHWFQITQGEIRGPNDSLIIFRGMQSYNADSIKSLEGFNRAWVAEAQNLSQRSLDLLRPTIRTEGSELWFDWNPESEEDPVDKLFRGANPPPGSVVIEANWRDNPWFPDVLKTEMESDRNADPEKAAHIWDGGYKQAPSGAYYARLLAEAKLTNRMGRVPHDPILDTHVSFDLGNGPNMAAWFSQWVGREVRVIDYLEGDEEAASEGWPWYIRKLKEKDYTYGKVILPHDARTRQRATGKGDEETLIAAKFKTTVVPRMDPGERVKLVQRYLPLCFIDEVRCAKGLKSLNNYQADYDEKLRIDRGPLHNWASHAADAFGHLFQAYEEPRIPRKAPTQHGHATSWMS